MSRRVVTILVVLAGLILVPTSAAMSFGSAVLVDSGWTTAMRPLL